MATAVCVVAAYQPPVMPRGNEGVVHSDSFTAQERCVSLCRFTL
jgi:hypothetical protein